MLTKFTETDYHHFYTAENKLQCDHKLFVGIFEILNGTVVAEPNTVKRRDCEGRLTAEPQVCRLSNLH